MGSPGTWEFLCLTNRIVASGTGLERDQALRISRPRGSERGEDGWSGEAKKISNSVVGTGSRSALIVLLTPGNVARTDPVEGSGAPWYRIAFEKHRGRIEA
jgi:hypothetical protein